MLRDLLERFKRVFTVKDWEHEAQDAMIKKEFVIASLDELHRVKKLETEQGQDRTMQRQPQGYGAPMRATPAPMGNAYSATRQPSAQNRQYSGSSLADLMNAVRQQQNGV